MHLGMRLLLLIETVEGFLPPSTCEPRTDTQRFTSVQCTTVQQPLLLEASASIDALCDAPEDDQDTASHEACAVSAKRALGIRTPLHLAAVHDSAEVAQLLLDRRADVASCVKGVAGAITPLHECAASDAARVARVLAVAAAAAAEVPEPWSEQRAGEGDRDKDQKSTQVAGEEQSETVEEEEVRWSRFLDPLQAKVGPLGSTPLQVAAEEDSSGVVAALLEARADPSLTDDQGDTPVHCATLYAAPRALMMLLSYGADAMCENSCGELPLHLIAEFGPGDLTDSETPDSMAKRHFSRSFRVQRELIAALRDRGQLSAALSHTNISDGGMPLHAVARWNHLGAANAAKLLVEARADMEAKNADGRTPLAVASRRFGSDGLVAKTLLESGAQAQAVESQDPLATVLGGQVRSLGTPAAGPELPLCSTQDTQEESVGA